MRPSQPPWFVLFLPSRVPSFFTCVSLCFLFKKSLLEMLKLCPLGSCLHDVNRQLPKSYVRDSRALLQLPCFRVTNRQCAVLEFSSNELAIQSQHQSERLSSLPLQLLCLLCPLFALPASPGKDWALTIAPVAVPAHLSELNNSLF